MRYGMSRGLFSNEAGLGSVPMVTVKGQGSAKQCALAACSSVFWDTLVVCTVTGLVLVCSMISTDQIFDDPIVLLEYTFSSFPDIGSLVFRISIVIFSYLTIVGWFCSAPQSASNLTGRKNCGWLSLLWSLVAAFGVITGQSILWSVADLLNAAMMLPNLYCLFCLRNEIQT
jgi:AGCS family alanine or glycine:cation symporter